MSQSGSMSITLESRMCVWCGCNDVGRWPDWQGKTRELRRSIAPFQQQN